MNVTFLRRSLQLDGVASGATGLLLLAGPLTLLGNLAVAAVAAAVLLFAMLEAVGLRRLRQA